ncbi:MAG: pyridoxine 5'-phosphate synthase [Sphingobacteriales bacterium]|nr:MAG: pyridoxine 5'-phosphate synthase [Sphingobacteriales bacterium]
MEKTRLSVNINKIALLRNARGGDLPDLIQIAKDCERFGAEGITVHPRPDERHIKFKDVYDLKSVVKTEFNIEGYPDENFIKMVLEVKPDQCTLVPDSPDALTSNAGWNTVKYGNFLRPIIEQMNNSGIRVSLFIETDSTMIKHASHTGAQRVELYTGPYAEEFYRNPSIAVNSYIEAAKTASELKLGLNAGHDLNLDNLKFFIKNIPTLLEVSIGHALICDSLYYGLENTIQLYLRQLIRNN